MVAEIIARYCDDEKTRARLAAELTYLLWRRQAEGVSMSQTTVTTLSILLTAAQGSYGLLSETAMVHAVNIMVEEKLIDHAAVTNMLAEIDRQS